MIFGFGKKKEKDELEKLKEKYLSEIKSFQLPKEQTVQTQTEQFQVQSIPKTQTELQDLKQLDERIKLLETKIESIRAQLDLINSKLEEIKFLLKR